MTLGEFRALPEFAAFVATAPLRRQVITLGSPIGVSPAVKAPLPVPSTSIYSRIDTIVDFHLSLDEPGPTSQNIEVRGSHFGLSHNPAVLLVVADRLAQPPGQWKPFSAPARVRFLYPAGPRS